MNRKDEILGAVISKIQEEGFSTDLTISQIAKKVDIGKSTIYEYFKTKDDIFKEALLKISSDSINAIISVDNIESMSFEEAFKVQFKKILEVSYKSRLIYQVFSKDFIHRMPSSIKEDLKQRISGTRETIENRFMMIFIKGTEEGLLRKNINPSKSLVFSSLIVGAIFRYSNSTVEISLDNFVDEIYKTIVKLGN